jgi:hypothetical protein
MQTSISSVAVYPSTANVLLIRSITLGPPPTYYYELQNVVGQVVTVLKNGNVNMTQAQWDAWGDGDDTDYQLDAIALNLGLTRA